MNGDYDFCKHDGCQKKVLNKTGLCQKHRETRCLWLKCETMTTSRQGARYCEKHMKLKPREEAVTWDLEEMEESGMEL